MRETRGEAGSRAVRGRTAASAVLLFSHSPWSLNRARIHAPNKCVEEYLDAIPRQASEQPQM